MNNIPLYVYITFCLSIHLSMDTSVVSISWLLWIGVYKYFFEMLLFVLLGIYLKAELSDYFVITFIFFWGTLIQFHIVTNPVLIYTNRTWELSFLQVLVSLCYLVVSLTSKTNEQTNNLCRKWYMYLFIALRMPPGWMYVISRKTWNPVLCL